MNTHLKTGLITDCPIELSSLPIRLLAKTIFCRADERSVIRRMATHTADNGLWPHPPYEDYFGLHEFVAILATHRIGKVRPRERTEFNADLLK